MKTQFIITVQHGVSLDISTQNGIAEHYKSEEFKQILEILNKACEAIKNIKSKRDYGSDL